MTSEDPIDDDALALAADGWRCRHCLRAFAGPEDHLEDECLVGEVMES